MFYYSERFKCSSEIVLYFDIEESVEVSLCPAHHFVKSSIEVHFSFSADVLSSVVETGFNLAACIFQVLNFVHFKFIIDKFREAT